MFINPFEISKEMSKIDTGLGIVKTYIKYKKFSSRMAEKNLDDNLEKTKLEFLNIVSHELKTPLTPMIAYLDLLLKGKLGKLTKQQREALETVTKNTKQLRHLIWDILDLSKLEAGNMRFNMRQIDLTELIKEVVKNMETVAKEKSIIIEPKIRPLPITEADRERLTQVITNLISNAIKFTPRKGKIIIETKKRGYSLMISVSDTGIGIPKKQLDNIFTKFFQVDSKTSRKYQGTGLGLTICKGIINAHGGDITVESTPRKGSTFHIKLPYKSLGKPTELFMEAFKEK